MMKFGIVGFLFSALILFSGLAHAEDCTQSKDSLQNLTEAAADILKQTQIDAVKKDTRDFCQRNMLLRGLNANGKTPPSVEKISTDELKEKYAQFIATPTDGVGTGWENSLIPTLNNRITAQYYGAKLLTTQSTINPYTGQSTAACPFGTGPSAYGCQNLPILSTPPEADVKKAAACLEISFWHSKNCKQGLDNIESSMKPIMLGQTTFMPPELWKKVLNDSKYDDGLARAALLIQSRALPGNMDSKSNIFSDLQKSFQDSGMKHDDAIDASFEILGLIGSSSGNLAGRLGLLGLTGANKKAQALSTISASLPLLDYKKSTARQGTLYSLPGSVSSTCDNAKTYYFWLSAYLSRTLVKENKIDVQGAVDATFVAAKGYQVNRELAHYQDHRGNAKSIITRPPYDPVQQVQRMDLNFAAAGAEFGAKSVKSDPNQINLNLDQSLVDMIEHSKVTPPVSKEEARGMGFISSYLQWEKEVSPNTALDAIKKQNP